MEELKEEADESTEEFSDEELLDELEEEELAEDEDWLLAESLDDELLLRTFFCAFLAAFLFFLSFADFLSFFVFFESTVLWCLTISEAPKPPLKLLLIAY